MIVYSLLPNENHSTTIRSYFNMQCIVVNKMGTETAHTGSGMVILKT